MASEPRRLAQLPGYDTAPDVYETPDIPDDTTTTSTSAATAPIFADHDDDDDDADDRSSSARSTDHDTDDGISHRRLYPQRARGRFGAQSRAIDPHAADWSDRVDGKRSGFRARRRRRDDGVDDERQPENLEARIARLKREIEECKVAALQEGQGNAQAGGGDEDEDDSHDLDAMAQLLASLDGPGVRRGGPASVRKANLRGVVNGATNNNPPPPLASETPSFSDEQLLSRITTFDTRIAALETALGISSLNSLTSSTATHTTPLLPSLTLLDQQLAALTSATSLTALDAASTRIAKLRADTHDLAAHAAQHQHAQSHPAVPRSTSPTPSTTSSHSEDQNLDASIALLAPTDGPRLHALYALLPTLQNLAPTVPPLLTRLQSLRTIHAAAARAVEDLDRVEEQQGRLDAQLKTWVQGLEKVEEAVENADKANGRNGMMVKEWVDELGRRVETLR